MPIVRMERSTKGSDNGFVVRQFEAGQCYEIGDALANTFVNVLKVATYADERLSERAVERAPENKDAAPQKVAAKEAPRRGRRGSEEE